MVETLWVQSPRPKTKRRENEVSVRSGHHCGDRTLGPRKHLLLPLGSLSSCLWGHQDTGHLVQPAVCWEGAEPGHSSPGHPWGAPAAGWPSPWGSPAWTPQVTTKQGDKSTEKAEPGRGGSEDPSVRAPTAQGGAGGLGLCFPLGLGSPGLR